MSQYRPHRQLVTRQKMTEAKANAYFFAYYSLGGNRSFEKVQRRLSDLGLNRVSLNTLARWSSQYHWLERIKEIDVKVASEMEAQRVQEVVQMNRDQARLGKGMQMVAGLGLSGLAPQGKLLENLKAGEVAVLAKEGAHLQRLALGEATSREEVAVQIWHRLIVPLVAEFKAVVAVLDQAQQEALALDFGGRVNRLVEAQLGNVGEGQN